MMVIFKSSVWVKLAPAIKILSIYLISQRKYCIVLQNFAQQNIK